MNFHLVHGNHEQYRICDDIYTWLQPLLESDGHFITRGELPHAYKCNVLVEGFDEHGSTIASRLDSRPWFCVVHTMPVNARFEAFIKTAQSAQEIWSINHDPHDLERYRLLFPDKVTRAMPYPCLPSVYRQDAAEEKEIDILFTGEITVYRRYVLSQLKAQGLNVVAVPVGAPLFIKRAALSQSKVYLDLPAAGLLSRASGLGIWYALTQGVCVAAQYGKSDGDGLDWIAGATTPEQIVPHCLDLARGGWQSHQENQRQLFSRERPQPLGLPAHESPCDIDAEPLILKWS
jgi:hypothetical protein